MYTLFILLKLTLAPHSWSSSLTAPQKDQLENVKKKKKKKPPVPPTRSCVSTVYTQTTASCHPQPAHLCHLAGIICATLTFVPSYKYNGVTGGIANEDHPASLGMWQTSLRPLNDVRLGLEHLNKGHESKPSPLRHSAPSLPTARSPSPRCAPTYHNHLMLIRASMDRYKNSAAIHYQGHKHSVNNSFPFHSYK